MPANYSGLQANVRTTGAALTANPDPTYDITSGWQIGDTIINSTNGALWTCYGNSSGAALWLLTNRTLVIKVPSVNFNTTADTALPFGLPAGWAVNVVRITAANPSVSCAAAIGGVYDVANKGGITLVPNTQTYGALLVGERQLLGINSNVAFTMYPGNSKLFLSLSTAAGVPATADVFLEVNLGF